MDITQLKSAQARDEQRATFTLYQKDGDPYLAADGAPVTFAVLGNESAAYRRARLLVQRRMLQGRQRRLEPEDLQRNRVAMAASVLVDWSGLEKDGAPWPCTQDNVMQLLGIEHVLEQVESAITGHADFFKTSSSS